MTDQQPVSKPQANRALGRLYALGGVSAALLIVLMLISGEKVVNAYTNEQSLAIQNANVQVQPVEVVSQYTKQQKVYGIIESSKSAQVGFELSGSLSKLMVTEGDLIKQGQVLAALDVARLNAQTRQLQASLKRAQADAEFAQISANRLNELVAAKLDSKQNLDQANARLKAANAAVVEVEEGLKALQVEINKSSIVAPFDGQVTSQLLDQGTVVSPGQPVFSLIASQQLEARFGLPMQSAFGVNVGEQYTLEFNGMPISAVLQSIAKHRNRATRAIDAVFFIQDDSNPYILQGDLVSLSVQSQTAQKGAWVPISALANGVRGLWTLYVAEPQKEESNQSQYKIASRIVAVEYIEDDRAYVTGAVSQGDFVVINGLQRLTPNQLISQVSIMSTVAGR